MRAISSRTVSTHPAEQAFRRYFSLLLSLARAFSLSFPRTGFDVPKAFMSGIVQADPKFPEGWFVDVKNELRDDARFACLIYRSILTVVDVKQR